tara:strand:- start:13038 stop:14828 length:1791 start_codon:yes stop_codon:yes gene_type:complete
MAYNLGGGAFSQILSTVNAAENRRKQNEASALDMIQKGFIRQGHGLTRDDEKEIDKGIGYHAGRIMDSGDFDPSEWIPGGHHPQVAENARRANELQRLKEKDEREREAARNQSYMDFLMHRQTENRLRDELTLEHSLTPQEYGEQRDYIARLEKENEQIWNDVVREFGGAASALLPNFMQREGYSDFTENKAAIKAYNERRHRTDEMYAALRSRALAGSTASGIDPIVARERKTTQAAYDEFSAVAGQVGIDMERFLGVPSRSGIAQELFNQDQRGGGRLGGAGGRGGRLGSPGLGGTTRTGGGGSGGIPVRNLPSASSSELDPGQQNPEANFFDFISALGDSDSQLRQGMRDRSEQRRSSQTPYITRSGTPMDAVNQARAFKKYSYPEREQSEFVPSDYPLAPHPIQSQLDDIKARNALERRQYYGDQWRQDVEAADSVPHHDSALDMDILGNWDMRISEPDSIGVENNNLGNIKFANQPGAEQDPHSEFAIFPSIEDGIRHLHRQVLLDAARGDTLEEFIYEYAPEEDNNDTESYLRDLMRATGGNRDTLISTLDRDALVNAILLRETGTRMTARMEDLPDMSGGDLRSQRFGR